MIKKQSLTKSCHELHVWIDWKEYEIGWNKMIMFYDLDDLKLGVTKIDTFLSHLQIILNFNFCFN